MGRTITTHIIGENPKGIQSIQLSNRTIKAFVIPRADYKKAEALEELQNTPCLYILLDENNETSRNKAYIGQTDNFADRIYNHNKEKDFWTKVIVFTSATLNKADVLYLEYLAINHAKEKGIYDISENKQNPKKPKLQRHTLDSLNEFFEEVIFITNFRGINIFKHEEVEEQTQRELFFITGRNTKAKGFYNEDGFTVLKGSILASDVVNSFANKEKRTTFINNYTETRSNKITLILDYTFNSPSSASSYCLGSNTNGWDLWKNKEGKSLDVVFRQQP